MGTRIHAATWQGPAELPDGAVRGTVGADADRPDVGDRGLPGNRSIPEGSVGKRGPDV